MRDLRAELKQWGDNDPISWQPEEGDILVGFLREPLPAVENSDEERQAIIIEERTGIPVSVPLASPVLAGLFDLHNPRCNDRIGLKSLGTDPDGVRRFVMVIDREAAAETATEDEPAGATTEERDYIENMLAEGDLDGRSATEPSPVTDLISKLPIRLDSPKPLATGIALLAMLLTGALLIACPQLLVNLLR